MITLRQLEVFATVVRSGGSVTQAANKLYVSQPSASDTLRALEKTLDTKMFAGRGKARALTAAGETYWGYTQQILALIDEAAQAVADLAEHPSGRLSVVAVPTAGEYLVPAVLHSFVEKYPAVDVSLMVANRADATEALRAGAADLAVMGRPPVGLGAEAIEFGDNRLPLLCAPDHPLVGTAPELRDIAASPFLIREAGSGTRAAIEQLFADHDLELTQTMVLGSNAAVLAAAREGLGLAVVPQIAAAEHLDRGELVELQVPYFPMLRRWHVVWLTSRPLSSPAVAFVDTLSGSEGV